jgi:hypothetical protein
MKLSRRTILGTNAADLVALCPAIARLPHNEGPFAVVPLKHDQLPRVSMVSGSTGH